MRIGFLIEKRQNDERTAKPKASEEGLSTEATSADEILLEELRRRYDLQIRENEVCSTKSSVVLAYLAAVGVVALGFTEGFATGWANRDYAVICLWLASSVSYLVAVVACVVTFRSRTLFAPLAVEQEEVEFYLSQERTDLVLQILSQYSHVVLRNARELKRKRTWFSVTVAATVVFTLLLLVTAAVTSLSSA